MINRVDNVNFEITFLDNNLAVVAVTLTFVLLSICHKIKAKKM